MEIGFSVHGDIQVVTVSGVLGDPEAAAVRFKLEQKINQGRMKVLFDLSAYTITDAAARNLILGVVIYSMNRGALTAISGIAAENWPLMVLAGNAQPKLLLSKTEGLDYLTKTPIPAEAQRAKVALLNDKKAEKPKEDEIKQTELAHLLRKYEVFQQSDADDPFRLMFFIEQYRTNPSHEALGAESKALHHFEQTTKDIELLEGECTRLAERVKSMMLMRKIPLSGKELELKEKSLDDRLKEVTQSTNVLKNQIAENIKARDEASAKTQDAMTKFETEAMELENKIIAQQTEVDKLQKELQSLK